MNFLDMGLPRRVVETQLPNHNYDSSKCNLELLSLCLIVVVYNQLNYVMCDCLMQGCESSDFNLISDFFALHKTTFSEF